MSTVYHIAHDVHATRDEVTGLLRVVVVNDLGFPSTIGLWLEHFAYLSDAKAVVRSWQSACTQAGVHPLSRTGIALCRDARIRRTEIPQKMAA